MRFNLKGRPRQVRADADVGYHVLLLVADDLGARGERPGGVPEPLGRVDIRPAPRRPVPGVILEAENAMKRERAGLERHDVRVGVDDNPIIQAGVGVLRLMRPVAIVRLQVRADTVRVGPVSIDHHAVAFGERRPDAEVEAESPTDDHGSVQPGHDDILEIPGQFTELELLPVGVGKHEFARGAFDYPCGRAEREGDPGSSRLKRLGTGLTRGMHGARGGRGERSDRGGKGNGNGRNRELARSSHRGSPLAFLHRHIATLSRNELIVHERDPKRSPPGASLPPVFAPVDGRPLRTYLLSHQVSSFITIRPIPADRRVSWPFPSRRRRPLRTERRGDAA